MLNPRSPLRRAFTAQVTACHILGLYLAQVRGAFRRRDRRLHGQARARVPGRAEGLDNVETVRQFARITGRDLGHLPGASRQLPVALEGALKLKKSCYIHARGFAAGELKHTAIALVDESQPVIVIVPTRAAPSCGRSWPASPGSVSAALARSVRRRGGDSSVDEFAGSSSACAGRRPVRPAPDRRAAADLRRRARLRRGIGRRPAAQPGKVRDGQVIRRRPYPVNAAGLVPHLGRARRVRVLRQIEIRSGVLRHRMIYKA